MADLLTKLNSLDKETLSFLGTFVTATASIIGAIIIAVLGTYLGKVWLGARDKQDKEVEWRNHAIELTKLDLERKIKARSEADRSRLRPSILDFLANYRDLQELGTKTPKELYLKITESRISDPGSENKTDQ